MWIHGLPIIILKLDKIVVQFIIMTMEFIYLATFFVEQLAQRDIEDCTNNDVKEAKGIIMLPLQTPLKNRH